MQDSRGTSRAHHALFNRIERFMEDEAGGRRGKEREQVSSRAGPRVPPFPTPPTLRHAETVRSRKGWEENTSSHRTDHIMRVRAIRGLQIAQGGWGARRA
ncbi:hypothetical protein KH5H1_62000 [Corallococcus caeni]|nr:hypothetical protein KH5H1_62000 [Corallococcus sp. KH5-1]